MPRLKAVQYHVIPEIGGRDPGKVYYLAALIDTATISISCTVRLAGDGRVAVHHKPLVEMRCPSPETEVWLRANFRPRLPRFQETGAPVYGNFHRGRWRLKSNEALVILKYVRDHLKSNQAQADAVINFMELAEFQYRTCLRRRESGSREWLMDEEIEQRNQIKIRLDDMNTQARDRNREYRSAGKKHR